MKINITSLCAIIFFIMTFTNLNYSQTYVDVAPGVGTLNDAVTNNTDPNVIFRLQRGPGAIYLLNGSVQAYIPIHIEAAAGTGDIPKLIPVVGTSGSSDIAFRLRSDLFLKNLYVTGMDAVGALKAQILRIQADSLKLYADSCYFENSAQSWIRTDNQMAKIRVTNSIIRNCLGYYANGRGVDDRGNNMDTLYLENNTFYNISSRLLRDGGGWMNYFYCNHNTFFNIGKSLFSIGECPSAVFTNNMAINCGFLGQNQSATGGLISIIALSSPEFNGRVQSLEAHNNNFANSSTFQSHRPDTVISVPDFDAQAHLTISTSGFDTTNISEFLTFENQTPPVDTIITGYWNTGLGQDAYPAATLMVTGDYNYSYPKTTVSYKGAVGGWEIGALTWFNFVTGVNDKNGNNKPSNYSLNQNYPNPFNPETVIEYTLPKQSNVKLIIYNSLGQEVKTLVNNVQFAGVNTMKWNGTNQSGQKVTSGIYFYKLTTEGFTAIKKMIMLK